MTPLSRLLPPLPGFTALARTCAPWPVWSGSTTQPVRFCPLAKKAAVKLWHRARDFDRGTHEPGQHGGAVSHTGLAVLHALIFDFLNHRTGRLDPFYAAIAAKAGVCVRTAASALQRLKALGILNWVRRCAERRDADGRFVLEQETNAYAKPPQPAGSYFPAPHRFAMQAGGDELGRGPTMHTVHNARIQLLATALNNLALAFIIAGFVAPAVTGQLPAGGHALVTLAWIALGVGLHFAAQAALGRLRQ